jgi:steroid delta-isomerase-like uncharacterized protein
MASTAPPVEATNGDLIRWAFELLNSRDVTPLRRFWTPETVQRFPQQTCVGPDAIAAYFEEAFAAMPDFRMEVVRLIESGEDVFVHWHLSGTHSGSPFQGIAPSGRAIALDGMDHFVLRDGVVVSNFIVYDQMQFARQIGMLPHDGSAADRVLKGAFNAKSRLSRRRG